MPEVQGPATEAAVAHVLCDARALADLRPAPAGAVWKLAEAGRQLDANLILIPAGDCIDTHAEPDLDVLLLAVAGEGTLYTAEGWRPLTEGVLVWLPHGSSRSITAGPEGLSYLTVHRRRPGMQIRRREDLFPVTAGPNSH